jgi:hypothetical protein
MMDELRRRFSTLGGRAEDLILRPVYWSPVIQSAEDELARRTALGGPLGYSQLRNFMISFAGDAIAYQPAPRERDVYEKIHKVMAHTLRALAEEAGPRAPLCVVAHSLGTVIASNYIYDLQARAKKNLLADPVLAVKGDTPLENGETLALLYTLGSPLALWSLRYQNFGSPIQIPSPDLARHWPQATGEWVNFYDKNDVIGFPLKTINPAYAAAVKEDRVVNVGNLLTTLTPLCHTAYWTDNDVTKPIAESLARVWRQTNEGVIS